MCECKLYKDRYVDKDGNVIADSASIIEVINQDKDIELTVEMQRSLADIKVLAEQVQGVEMQHLQTTLEVVVDQDTSLVKLNYWFLIVLIFK